MDRPLAPRMGLQLPGPSALLRPLRTHRPHLGGRTRVLLAGLAVALCLFAVGWLWLRHSSLFSASHVRIEGVSGPQAVAIDGALLEAAHRMSTLDVNTAALRAAVAPFGVVGDVRATASFPHSLRIEVIERLPVAALTSSGSRTAVAADGVVLGPGLLHGSLPTVAVAQLPPTGRRVPGAMQGALTVLGAAPPPLRVHVLAVANGARGLTVTMRNGLIVYFGDATRAHAKWLALAAVLADPTAAGAGYVDVRVPARPAAGYAPGSAPASAQPAGSDGAVRLTGLGIGRLRDRRRADARRRLDGVEHGHAGRLRHRARPPNRPPNRPRAPGKRPRAVAAPKPPPKGVDRHSGCT